ncbi:hypothetical protein VNI00_018189 [Paramarasmius palmivorus]|uniref:Nephrocystin 3-like N-terminal domain-containing protein n=1 Tax=Paramarasmius palmivorus TaxID=297713 RepID=A0AAW0B0T1_9AGAR
MRHPPPKCDPDTRLEILKKLRAWIRRKGGSNRCRIFWVYGTVGVGKSAIAQTLCEEFAGSNMLANFFFSRTDSTRNNVNQFVATIAYQLATYQGQLNHRWTKSAIMEVVRENPNILDGVSMESVFEQLVLRPCLAVRSWMRTKGVVVVDGLDECLDVKSQERLLLLLWKAVTANPSPPIDFLLFSRPDRQIVGYFNRICQTELERMGITNTFQTDRDIETFLNARFREITKKHSTAMKNVPEVWPGSSIVTQLVQKACGQFVYATTVAKYVDDPHALPTERLDEILNMKTESCPYTDLDLLYHQILRNCRDIRTVKRILQLVLYSESDIASNEPWLIAWVLELKEEMIPILLSALHSVLDVPDANTHERIQVYHASFSDYLRDAERSKEFFVPPPPDCLRLHATFLSELRDIRSRHCLPHSWPGKTSIEHVIERASGEVAYLQALARYLYLCGGKPEEELAAILQSEPDYPSMTARILLLYDHIARGYGDSQLTPDWNILAPLHEW